MAEIIHTTTCPLDCPDACALEVTVSDGSVTRIGAGSGNPVTGGFICSKVSRFARRLDHPDRIRHPMRRTGGKGESEFERTTWDDALAEIVARFEKIGAKWGGEAILGYHYGGSNGVLTDGFLDDLFFARLGASRLDLTICAAPTTAVATGMYGKMPGVAFEDYVHAKCIVIWGANPKASNTHLVPFLKEARRRGATVVSVDPVRNLSERESDLHLAVRPGTDLPVALAMVRLFRGEGWLDEGFLDRHVRNSDVLLDAADAWPVKRAANISGVAVDDIRKVAQILAQSGPAVIRCGWGVERNRNGGQAVAAILAMPALLGKFGVRGGGYTMSNSGAARVDFSGLFDVSDWSTRRLNMTRLGAYLNGKCDPPIKALFVYNCNPAATVPDQNAVLRGLGREDLFTVVFEQVMTDTAAFADIVLPATTFLEHWDLKVSYGSYVVGGVKPTMEALGDARSNHWVFGALGRAMGFSDEAFQWDEETAFERATHALSLEGEPADVELLRAGRTQAHRLPAFCPVQFEGVFPRTPDGKVDLCPSVLGGQPYAYRAVDGKTFPLALLSPATSRLTTSTFGESSLRELTVLIHPDDAGSRAVGDGDEVRVFNELGEVICRARVSASVRPGVLSMPKGAWRRSSGNGLTSTALCPADTNVVAGGACFNDARVELEKVLD
jgi:anaerobic selenocysteine-containing dehydrogenase